IQVAFFAAAATISGNTVSGINNNGILLGGILQPATISGNTVIPGPPQDPNMTGGNGILFGNSRGASVWITRNTVICENPNADGIYFLGGGAAPLLADNSVVEKNDVTMHGSLFGGISF